jgi:hypothetical protein
MTARWGEFLCTPSAAEERASFARMKHTVRATRSDRKIAGWRMPLDGRRAAALSEPVRIVLACAALTDIVVRLITVSRAACTARTERTSDIEKLREFERAWERQTGEQLTTAAFYDRFCAGDFDTQFGERWAGYYEATLGRPPTRDGLSHLGLHRPRRG